MKAGKRDIPITLRVVKPRQCIFVFGIPTSEEAYVASRQSAGDYYAKKYLKWEHYDKAFSQNALQVQEAARELGVNVRKYVSCQEFCELFNGAFDVIILFSHWSGEAIEFKYGFGTAARIAHNIANTDFAGIVDFTICQSRPSGDRVKHRCPNCAVFVGDEDLSPNFWLAYYLALFKQLKDNRFSYLDADEENRKYLAANLKMDMDEPAAAEHFEGCSEAQPKHLGPEPTTAYEAKQKHETAYFQKGIVND